MPESSFVIFPRWPRSARLIVVSYIGAVCGGCVDIDWSVQPSADAGVTPVVPSSLSDAATPPDTTPPDSVPPEPAAEEPEAIAPSPRWVRLTHAQWLQASRDVLGLEQLPSDVALPPDPQTAGFLFDNHAASLQVDEVLLQAYQRAAARFAQVATEDEAALQRLLPAAVSDESDQARQLIAELGARAFRRPLEASERERYFELYQLGRDAYPEELGHLGGLRLLIEGFLQSPYFLYRSELGDESDATRVPLTAFELAQRLSFLVTRSVPDAKLWEAAESGRLLEPDVLRRHAERLLAGERAKLVVRDYHSQLFDFSTYTSVASRAVPELGDAALREAQLFVDHVFSEGGGLRELLTERTAFVDATLASVYDTDPPAGDAFELRELDASRRAGILTRAGFLASNATSEQPDPIHRGVFVLRRITCQQVAAPPDAIPPLPPVDGRTNRETVAEHTESSAACAACHEKLINPFGFPFEHYDAVGRFRASDNGFDVDSVASPFIDGAARRVAGAVELSEVLAESDGAHRCYVKHLFEFAIGRVATKHDAALLAELEGLSQESAGSTAELLLTIIASPVFRYRSTQEMP